ncbi:hypothetical protein MOV00_000252 [Vibrio vulnificus]|nr:hypothetical protein [Vibrio vulnificus]EKG2458964.1 hypothetical protein [Vibrio vulnificus]
MDKLVEKFFEQRALSKDIQLNEPLYKALFYLEKSNELVEELCNKNQSELIKNVPWPTMHDMYRRNYEYCCGVISCFLVGQFQSSEALCRTAIEGAVNLHYVSLGDSMSKQIAYFKNYLVTERKQNKNWKESVEASSFPQAGKDHHLQTILEKEGALNHYEEALRESLRLAGVDFDAVDLKWPSIFDRFKEIGEEVGYRTVYAALCSQAHNDAEDILNKIMARVIDNVSGMEEAQWIEQYNFSLYLMLRALDYQITASAMYVAKFNIKVDALVQLKKEVIETTSLVIEQGPELVRERITVK